MSSSSVMQRSFSGGEIAPALGARTDQVKYATGLRVCRNFIVARGGGVFNRPGTRFVAEVKDSSKAVRLIKFVFNAEQTYVLEFGHLYMRVFRAGAAVDVAGDDAPDAWDGGTAYVLGDLAGDAGVSYYCILGHTNQQPPNGTYWYPLTDHIYEIPTPYEEGDLADLHTVQSADVVTIAHPSHAPRQLARYGHTRWTLTAISFAPTQQPPTSPIATKGGAGALTFDYRVTAVAEETYEESLPTATASATSAAAPSSSAPHVISWTAPAGGAAEYNVYKALNGVYGYIGVAQGLTFNDTGITADVSRTPPTARNPFDGAGKYPSVVTYFQQRLTFAASDNEPEKVWMSKTANFHNFTVSSPLQDDDAVTFTVTGRSVNAIRHVVDIGKMILLTGGGEWTAEGDEAGVIRPSAINLRQQSYQGAAGGSLAPIIVGNSLLYCQARGSVVRDLRYSLETDGYAGNDLTVFASHLFDGPPGYTIATWDYQQIPHSVVWACRSDGALLGMTYLREHQVWGWHRHDTTDGQFEQVCCVPEGDEDAVYVVVCREVDGSSVRYVERMATRRVADVVDAFFVDAGLSYDGRNADAGLTMTLSGGSTWSFTEDLTLTSSASFFAEAEIGNAIVLTVDGVTLRLTITAYSSATEVTVRADRNVPEPFRDTAIADWSRAVDVVAGLDHLEGCTVSVLADGNVEPQAVVADGQITLQRPCSVIHVGLPITADIETLNMDMPPGAGGTLADKPKLITRVSLLVESSRGIYVGPDAEHLFEHKQRETENYGDPIALATGAIEVPVESVWNDNGRIFIRQADPLPLTVLAAVPSLTAGGR